ncbi:MAG TPA: 3'(2'),5'-bisphosphate nucleotidase CysQ [Xanthobacteraceae bacterium]|nr:3'(2'),5'-bisphosphate nucleotidase CysQ [Xanthobacteraceae bacterium]
MAIANEQELRPAEAAKALADAALAAGKLALSMRAGVKHWKKDANSPVSEADIAADDLLRARLSALAPSYGWLSEETADRPDRLTRRRVWVVDPIDGTRAYLAGDPDWSVSVALVEDGRPLAAALYAPASEELFIAAAAGGATRNGKPLRANARGALAHARVTGNKARVERMIRAGIALDAAPKIYSLALRLARVATGELDAAFASAASYDWDLAAADLLVHEAGAVLTTVDGDRLVYNRAEIRHGELVAAGQALHAPLLAALKGATKGRDLTANA